MKLSVENIGENAFLSKMTIQYADDFEPIGVKFINVSHSYMKPDGHAGAGGGLWAAAATFFTTL